MHASGILEWLMYVADSHCGLGLCSAGTSSGEVKPMILTDRTTAVWENEVTCRKSQEQGLEFKEDEGMGLSRREWTSTGGVGVSMNW